MVSVVLIAAWFATGGYDRLTVPNPHWKLPNGDTIEVLAYDQYYEAMYDIFGHRLQGANSLRLWFRSDFRDAARDHSDVVAASQVICPLADSAGLTMVKIEPTRPSFLIFHASHTYWFKVHHGGSCVETGGHS